MYKQNFNPKPILTKALESRLDSLIYQAYGLNEKEINLIESELSTRERERERTEIIENLYRLYTQFYDFTYNFTMESQVTYQGKILYPCIMANKSCFVYEEKGFFAPAPANLITGKECDMKYLTGFLNSSFVYFLMREFYDRAYKNYHESKALNQGNPYFDI